MFANSKYSVEVHIHRKRKANPWGRIAEENKTKDARHSAVFGVPYSHTLDWAVMGPRTTEQSRQAAQHAPMTYSGITMFCDPYCDIRSDDIVVWRDEAGKRKVYRVEGTDSNDFVSPWTGLGGKEVHLGEVKARNSIGRGE